MDQSQLASALSLRYAEPHRAYHGLPHIKALLSLLDQHSKLAQDKALIAAAIWFHDAIYDPRRSDNEELSAQLAEQLLAQWHAPADWQHRVPSMVPAPIYAIKRAEVLRSFLNRPHLYFTPALQDLWESAARLNLQSELSALAKTSPSLC